MQQEASRKMYFGARKMMQGGAEPIYEGVRIGGENVGLITYMRTDGVQMAREAIANQFVTTSSRRVWALSHLPDR